MGPYERRDAILAEIKANHSVRVAQLSDEFGVTRETIRQDLYYLDEQGAIRKVHGGAVDRTVLEDEYEKRATQHRKEKMSIAKKALKHIQKGMTIFIDYGTTNFFIAKALSQSDLEPITVVTDSLPVAATLASSPGKDVILLGGDLRKTERSLSGGLTLQAVDGIYMDVGFFGCGGISLNSGITNHDFSEVTVSKKSMSHCQETVLVADNSKFNLTTTYKTADFDDIDILITDYQLSEDFDKVCQIHNIEVDN
ncbi:DeoR/GlpR family DNA-binding transcription regulator [Lactiplantibacillus daowaiensis]|uniref:DeoR/GlpR family DNA-binding transcription regulator n=1 Tax=Lactiplantibacillus daowaiensis TaxID=2559918 RepID=A0ABW1S1P3_9LACO|nr:DeoR/GlpR family DNA-binding transcription regulator [Lactiplantibacillus daowaiensis]